MHSENRLCKPTFVDSSVERGSLNGQGHDRGMTCWLVGWANCSLAVDCELGKGVAGDAARASKRTESAKLQSNDKDCSIEWGAWRETDCTESARRSGGEKCALDGGSAEREQRSTGGRGFPLMSLASDRSRDGARIIRSSKTTRSITKL